MTHVYDGFGSLKNKNRFICVSEITRPNVRKMGIPDCISLDEVKKSFYQLRYILVRTGNYKNKHQTRATRYVNKFELYHYVINGRRVIEKR